MVFDRRFSTHNSTITQINGSNSSISGGVSVPGPFYGVDEIAYVFGFDTNVIGKTFTRYDDNLNVIDSFTLTENNNTLLQWMKDAALQAGGIYSIEFPQNNPNDYVVLELTNLLSTDDEIIIGIEYDGNVDCSVRASHLYAGATLYNYNEVTSFEQVRNATSEAFWQDHTNDMVWVKAKGGRVNNQFSGIDDWEPYIYQGFLIHLESN